MNSATIENLLPNSKVKLADNNLVLLLSIFYNHPRLLAEDGWELLKVGSENILIDTDTAYILKDKEIELIWDKDHITHLKLTSRLQGDALKKHWEEMVQYASSVQRDMTAHFDKSKVDELCDSLSSVSIKEAASSSSDRSDDTDHALDKTLPKEEQSLPTSTS